MAKAAAKKPLTKTELLTNIAAAADVSKKEVAAVLEALAAEIKKSLGNKGAGVIAIPGLVKIEKKKVPRPQGREGRAEPLQAGRADGPRRQAGLQQGQGPGAEGPEGHGEVVSVAEDGKPVPCPRLRGHAPVATTAASRAIYSMATRAWPWHPRHASVRLRYHYPSIYYCLRQRLLKILTPASLTCVPATSSNLTWVSPVRCSSPTSPTLVSLK